MLDCSLELISIP